jgi:hypothetical protein
VLQLRHFRWQCRLSNAAAVVTENRTAEFRSGDLRAVAPPLSKFVDKVNCVFKAMRRGIVLT